MHTDGVAIYTFRIELSIFAYEGIEGVAMFKFLPFRIDPFMASVAGGVADKLKSFRRGQTGKRILILDEVLHLQL